MSDDRTELTRRWAARCDELEADNAKLREQVKQFKESIAYASVTIAVLRSQVDDLTKASRNDDAEPITEEWLLSNGFVDDGDEERWTSGSHFGNCVVSNRQGICVGYFSGNHTSLVRTDIATRGRLRKLLEALKGATP